MGSGMWLTMGILAALYKRNTTGEGSKVSNSLLETGVAWGSLQLSTFMETGKVPQKLGTAMPLIAPYEAFKAEEGWVMIAAGNNRLFEKLCTVLGIDEIPVDPRFSTNGERVKNRYELHDLLEKETQKYSVDLLIQMLRSGDVPCSPINSLDKVMTDEQVNVLGLIKQVEHSRVNDYKMVDIPFAINNVRSTLQNVAPMLGEHSEEVLKQIGYTDNEINQLLVDKVIDSVDKVRR
jgi:crotonobetainyl-CoA:carnitine CoA-transferase CaiB-like acyl-CoA transferase